MKLHLVCVGRLTAPFVKQGCQLYANRLKHYLPLKITEIKEQKTGKKPNVPFILAQEGAQLLQQLSPGTFMVALDERGKSMTSKGLASLLQQHMSAGTPELAWVIGGPFGLSDTVRQHADYLMALSSMTMTHQMARLILLEQLYRAGTIIRNEPYHHS
ncbi:MAG: 23S rRNA (pseudouridine(1915)-N(3))-methyltransferase RlmH [Deltaproteobacteria bacterium]|nr:23S rRNA (pseudouridine(1915)-N(3))-methyltransferase RlmH [Deltaproteobacteria bacterium]MBW2504327.1 23S rRNA (pseudouridine(1915)-N(3))-methyltransferase RlmH [Deltaproteobacteria bacterium]MBW2519105.1 23S rRNA (pseudouridine(1915)-N(3))-methyltransferase RlmH [Deltaproteobacteria bacterium]